MSANNISPTDGSPCKAGENESLLWKILVKYLEFVSVVGDLIRRSSEATTAVATAATTAHADSPSASTAATAIGASSSAGLGFDRTTGTPFSTVVKIYI